MKSQSATQVALKVFKEKGFRGFYQGGTATLSRDVFFSAVYFPMFATFNQMVNVAIRLRYKYFLIKS